MDETMTGVFKCRCCGAEIKEKTSVTRSVAWAIKDMKDDSCDLQSTTAIQNHLYRSGLSFTGAKRQDFASAILSDGK